MQQGLLKLGIRKDHRAKSFVSQMQYKFPLKVMSPFYLDRRGTAFIYVFDTAGGMLSGDSADYEIQVEDGAGLYLTNSSTSKIYPMPEGTAYVGQRFRVGQGASLENFPEAVMLFKQSHLNMETKIELTSDSVLAHSEVYASGRKGMGESFQFRGVSNQFKLYIDGKLSLWEKYRLDMTQGNYEKLCYLEGYTHWGSLYMYASGEQAMRLEWLREHLGERYADEMKLGCSLHPSGVITVKALANSDEAVKACFHDIWSFMRPHLLKGELPYIRK